MTWFQVNDMPTPTEAERTALQVILEYTIQNPLSAQEMKRVDPPIVPKKKY